MGSWLQGWEGKGSHLGAAGVLVHPGRRALTRAIPRCQGASLRSLSQRLGVPVPWESCRLRG